MVVVIVVLDGGDSSHGTPGWRIHPKRCWWVIFRGGIFLAQVSVHIKSIRAANQKIFVVPRKICTYGMKYDKDVATILLHKD